ncbi:MAG TPA: protein-tyrosine phosphatase family protein [Acidimicrobiales bacterium]
MPTAAWDDDAGVVTLPGGARVRGRRLAAPACPADFGLVLAPRPAPAWPHRRIRWPDFWIPTDRADALDALAEALRRARAGERVEVACRGGVGRTGTALAALAVLDGLPTGEAVAWVRAAYHPRAVETPWQRRWLRSLAPAPAPAPGAAAGHARSAQ